MKCNGIQSAQNGFAWWSLIIVLHLLRADKTMSRKQTERHKPVIWTLLLFLLYWLLQGHSYFIQMDLFPSGQCVIISHGFLCLFLTHESVLSAVLCQDAIQVPFDRSVLQSLLTWLPGFLFKTTIRISPRGEHSLKVLGCHLRTSFCSQFFWKRYVHLFILGYLFRWKRWASLNFCAQYIHFLENDLFLEQLGQESVPICDPNMCKVII